VRIGLAGPFDQALLLLGPPLRRVACVSVNYEPHVAADRSDYVLARSRPRSTEVRLHEGRPID